MKKNIKENAIDGAPAGFAGIVNYQASLNTPDPQGRNSADLADNKPNTVKIDPDEKHIGSHSNTTKDFQNPEDMQKAVNQIYDKKSVPSAEVVKAALDYELHNMIKPDTHKAKEIVLGNLRKNPQHYTDLNHLNVNDKTMDVPINEVVKNINVEETKKIFDGLTVKKDTKFAVNQGISDIMRDLWKARNERPKWKKGDPTF